MTSPLWNIWIDTGGTFTDCLARDPSGLLHRAKVLSTGAMRGRLVEGLEGSRLKVDVNWEACDDFIRGFEFRVLGGDHSTLKVTHFDATDSIIELNGDLAGGDISDRSFEVTSNEPAPILAARLVTGTPAGSPLPGLSMRLGTTRGTNALLERRGAKLALFITKGFGDLLLIGDQQRPDLFALDIIKPEPLYEEVIEVVGRLAADGSVIEPLDLDDVEKHARALVERGITVAAVTLMHSYRNPAHEIAVAEVLERVGFTHVSGSAELSPLIRILHRAETTVVDAYLDPLITSYLDDVARRISTSLSDGNIDPNFRGRGLHVMTSAGGLVGAESYRARDSLLSGPAGGVAGAAVAAKMSGHDKIIGFDMGGTSTDVARYDGDYEYCFEQKIAGVRLVAPALAIETVAAGGGSICRYTDDRLQVGPQSAAADPGPACYGAGGPLAITDVNLLSGRLDPGIFEIPISIDHAQRALDEVCARITASTGTPTQPDDILDGFLDIANERMADAIAQISLRQGYDPAEYALVGFGGAGGQHACAIADRLGIKTVIMPADASLLSALGIGHASIERFEERQILALLDEVETELETWFGDMSGRAINAVEAEGVSREEITIRRRLVNMRLLGQDTSLSIDLAPGGELRTLFAARYTSMYGTSPDLSGKPIEIESIRVVASSAHIEPQATIAAVEALEATANRTVRARFEKSWREINAFQRDDLVAGSSFRGPAIIFDRRSSYVIEPGWEGMIDQAGAIIVARASRLCEEEEPHRRDACPTMKESGQPEVVTQELFTNRFSSIAEEMGRMLERTALSTNVKERLDFSCTLLNADGELLVNAPHMPVHLGAMGLCVRSVREVIEMREGDVIVTNHPAFGGSHLPDITVITPVFDNTGKLLGYTASRAHHAEVGGTRPGSMPPDAKTLAEEGVVILPRYLIENGVSRFDEVGRLLRSGPFPSRSVEDNLADLRAQVAANLRGAQSFRGLADRYGAGVIHEQMAALRGRAERLARDALQAMPDGRYEALEYLDDGAAIHVTIEIQGDAAVIDFAGTAATHPGNLNATPAIVTSAVIYILRVMIGERLPLNEGIMQAVELRIPPGCMLNPEFPDDPALCPAVVGGNVETSQRIVGTLLKALKLCASAQGTMNNLLFGNENFGYYETVCGGSGAGPGFDGASAVHTHMTNTRITDPEIIEHRYPVRVERFGIRRGSGGAGKYRGGDGAVRELLFLEPVSLSILSQHRNQGPFGLEGGSPGAPGSQRVVRSDGDTIDLGAVDGCEIQTGDRLILETPGGGGYGASCLE
ncbi:MAG: hydantoinase B/oxoprolinase family protein [Planctomycetes bacterium]|nr:hydantoinase B/oxoprolinase family protein [Planctomycetota bacterium]